MTVETNQDQLDVQSESIESSINQADEVAVEIIDAPPAISDEASDESSEIVEAADEVAAGEEADANDAEEETAAADEEADEEADADDADADTIEASDDEAADDGSDDADDDSEATD